MRGHVFALQAINDFSQNGNDGKNVLMIKFGGFQMVPGRHGGRQPLAGDHLPQVPGGHHTSNVSPDMHPRHPKAQGYREGSVPPALGAGIPP